MPGLFAAGTFYYHGELVFGDVRHPEQAIIVSLQHERFKKLIVEVENPYETVTKAPTGDRNQQGVDSALTSRRQPLLEKIPLLVKYSGVEQPNGAERGRRLPPWP